MEGLKVGWVGRADQVLSGQEGQGGRALCLNVIRRKPGASSSSRATKPASSGLLILRLSTFFWDFCAKIKPLQIDSCLRTLRSNQFVSRLRGTPRFGRKSP